MPPLDPEICRLAREHVQKLERLALAERKTTERGADAVRSLAVMALLVAGCDDGDAAEIIDLALFRSAA